jgi:hypothetical protein
VRRRSRWSSISLSRKVIGEVKLTETPHGLEAETRITDPDYIEKFVKSVMEPETFSISIDRHAFRKEQDGTS